MGGHYQITLEKFGELFAFFWNTEPLQLRGERTFDQRSPMQRMSEHTDLPLPIDTGQPWWNWLRPLAYHDYRLQVKHQREQIVAEHKSLRKKKDWSPSDPYLTPEKKATQRWSNSRTLAQVSDLFKLPPPEVTPPILPTQGEIPANSLDFAIYQLLKKYPEGLHRPQLVILVKRPSTTIYDALVRLELIHKVIRVTISSQRTGRPLVKFKAVIRHPS